MTNILESFSLDGKKAIVTGGAKGLSYGIAQGLYEAGAEVVLFDILDTVGESAHMLSGEDGMVHAIRVDIGDPSNRDDAFVKALDLLEGQLHILVNGAGVQHRCEAESFPGEQWEKVLAINLSSVFYMCKLASSVMLPAGYGRIINIASMISFFGGVMIPAYAASKGGVAQLTKALSNEWSGRGVNVNAIAPGYFQTDLSAALHSLPGQAEDATKRIPKGRWGKADDLMGLAVFLASDASEYMSGAVIPMDGGYLAR